jgi:hypothetical protein
MSFRARLARLERLMPRPSKHTCTGIEFIDVYPGSPAPSPLPECQECDRHQRIRRIEVVRPAMSLDPGLVRP